ncbi:MAG: UPF0058 family protein [Halorubrum sp.]|uniref:UPF0058 family protein n=1 Tax=Haloferacaceae TaxID=1644056 RepID=UPI0010FB93DE|nr:UPF0058 family protein [Halalkalirubrum salinum]
MKKNELMHVHALLVQVVEDLLDRGVVDPSHFDAYRELEVSPVDFRVRRDRHEEAVLLLASLVVSAIDEETDERETVSAQ